MDDLKAGEFLWDYSDEMLTDLAVKDKGNQDAHEKESQEEMKSDDVKHELDAKAWFKRRREQIARASRKARLKRRLKVDELQRENEKLREERSLFLAKIEDLQRKVAHLKSDGQVDVQLENELLTAQLEEHKRFLSGCFKLQHGIPSPQQTYANLQAKGTSYAETYVQSLLSRSSAEKWDPIKLDPKLFTSLKPGYNATGCCKRINGALHVRIDLAFKDISIEVAAQTYWSTWTNPDVVGARYGITYPFQCTRIDIPTVSEEEKENTATMCHVERPESGEPHCEWIFVASRKREELVKSTLAISREFTPSLMRGEGESGSPPPGQIPKRKRKRVSKKSGKSKEQALGTFGKAKGWLLSRSTTQHVPVETKEGVQRIEGLLIEGAALWEQGIYYEDTELEASFVDSQETERLVEREMCSRMAIVIAIPKQVGLGVLGKPNDFIDENNTLAPLWSNNLERFIQNVRALTPKVE